MWSRGLASLAIFTLTLVILVRVSKSATKQDYGENLQYLKDDFKALDKNDDGYVDAHELRSAVPGIFEDDITSFFDRYDTDRDAVISLEEYLMVIHNAPQDNPNQNQNPDQSAATK